MIRHNFILTTLCASSAFSSPDPASFIQSVASTVPSDSVFVSGKQLTRLLVADGLTEVLRDRLLEFMETDPSTWVIDPITQERTDALRRVRFTRDAESLRHEFVVLYVFDNEGQPRRHTTIWTNTNRFEQSLQSNEIVDRQTTQKARLNEFIDQVASGVRPWDLSRANDGGYFECVSIALRLLSQASDIKIVTTGTDYLLESQEARISLRFDPVVLSVTEVALPNPGWQGHTVHTFGGQLDSSTVGHHPEYWVLEMVNGSERRRVQTVVFETARKASATEAAKAFRWELLGDLVRDRVSGIVYRKDGSVNQAATDTSVRIAQSEPVPFFDVKQTDEGAVIKAHTPRGVSVRVAVIALGVGMVLIGAIATFRSGAGR